MVRTNQGGSVLGFIVVGIVAIVVLIGGVYVVRHQQDIQLQPAPTEVPKPQETQKPSSSGSEKPAQQPRASEKSTEPAKETPVTQAPPAAQPTDSAQLPHTGPSEMFGSLLSVGLISLVVSSYLRSRRPGLSL